MKRLYIITLMGAMSGALCASAAVPSQLPIKPGIKTLRTLPAGKQQAGKALAGTASTAKAPAKAEARWVDFGTGTYCDDLSTGFFMVNPVTYQVKVQKDEANPGMYRIVNPWKDNPNKAAIEDEGGVLDITDNSYITIDATNPDYVRIPESPLGLADSDGATTVVSLTELVGKMANLDQETADLAAGKLVDGIVTFATGRSLSLHQGEIYYAANSTGAFTLALPGASVPVDYDLSIKIAEVFCPDANFDYHVTFTGDTRIPSVKYMVVKEIPEDDDELSALIADVLSKGKTAGINEAVTVSVAGQTSKVVNLVALALDGDGVEQSAGAAELYVPYDDSAEWENVGKASFTEGFMSGVLPQYFNVETYEVDVEQNKANPGLIRIVEPYSPWSYAGMFLVNHGHKHYIEFNVENPDNVYVATSPIGLQADPYGEWGISSDYYELLSMYDLDLIQWLGFKSGGSLKDGIIEFDGDCDIKLLPSSLGKYYYTNFKENPEYDKDAADAAAAAGQDYDVPMYLPGDFRLDLSKTTGIADAVVPTESFDGRAVYYNLQGARLDSPAPGTVCIRVQGSRTEKVVVR